MAASYAEDEKVPPEHEMAEGIRELAELRQGLVESLLTTPKESMPRDTKWSRLRRAGIALLIDHGIPINGHQ